MLVLRQKDIISECCHWETWTKVFIVIVFAVQISCRDRNCICHSLGYFSVTLVSINIPVMLCWFPAQKLGPFWQLWQKCGFSLDENYCNYCSFGKKWSCLVVFIKNCANCNFLASHVFFCFSVLVGLYLNIAKLFWVAPKPKVLYMIKPILHKANVLASCAIFLLLLIFFLLTKLYLWIHVAYYWQWMLSESYSFGLNTFPPNMSFWM